MRLTQLGPVRGCLLEVVADDLVELDEVGSVVVQPVGEALV